MFKSFTILVAFLLCSCTQQLPSSTTEGTALKALLESSTKPAVIKFHAKWCASCKQYAPAFEEVKAALSEGTDFFEIDVDEASNKALVKELKIARIPETVFVSADRQNVFKRLGPISATDLTKTINELGAH